jgi:hypothetical protein
MAVPPTPVDSVSQQLDDIEGVDGAFTTLPPEKPTEIYRLDPKTKIPVSKHEGPMWKSRKSAGDKALRDVRESWEEAEYYYNNAQQNHRKDTMGNRAGNRNAGKDRRDQFSMTENIVYATVNAVIPNIYAKNPNIEVTMTDESLAQFGVVLEHLANKLAAMRSAPGINLKAKARKSIVRCEITNEAWIMVGYNIRDQGQDQARFDIQKLGAELAKAKDRKTIERIEGELLALEETIDLLDPPGPFVRSFRGDQVRVDPGNTEDDTSDCQWIMVQVMFPTVYLNARYRQKGKDGDYVSAYKATHVVDASSSPGTENVQQQIDNFKLFDTDSDAPNSYGYKDRNSYERGKMTECWYVFDKIKRRFMLFADNDWSWPIWVFDDPYHFPDFFPLEKLQYHTDPRQTRVRGEVSHYLDQQDEINTIVDEGNRARISLRDNTIFDSNVLTAKDVEDILLNANKKMKGVKVPEGRKLEDLIMGPPMPTLEYQFLWDKSSAKAAIGMIAGIQDAMRGEQYKTNTTNEAIEQYNSISGQRLDEKRDAIEDFIGGIMAKVLFLCLQFMDQETVATLVGSQYQEGVSMWRNMTPEEIRKTVQCSIEGGSTLKPTSAAKKAEALQVGQILGQFASQSPHVVLVVLKMFQRAFDSVTITDADWQMLTEGIMAQLQGPPAAPGAGAGPQLPPEGEQIVGELVKQGMPEDMARAEVAKKLTGAPSNGAAGPPQAPPQ